MVFPLEIQNSRPYIKVSVPGSKPFLALLDTGSPGSLLPASAVEKLKLKPIRIESISRYDVPVVTPPAKDPVKEGGVVGNKEGVKSVKTGGLKEDVKEDAKDGIKGAMKDGKAALVVLPKLNIGKLEWKNQRIVYLTADSAPEFNRELAILGMDIISSYRVTLNFDRKQVQFTPLIQETKEP